MNVLKIHLNISNGTLSSPCFNSSMYLDISGAWNEQEKCNSNTLLPFKLKSSRTSTACSTGSYILLFTWEKCEITSNHWVTSSYQRALCPPKCSHFCLIRSRGCTRFAFIVIHLYSEDLWLRWCILNFQITKTWRNNEIRNL